MRNNLFVIALIAIFLASISALETTCPKGWDQSTYPRCAVPQNYSRGLGYPWKFGDSMNLDGAKNRCEAENTEFGCEKFGAIYYPKCIEAFKSFGCCHCVFSACPEGDQGVYDYNAHRMTACYRV